MLLYSLCDFIISNVLLFTVITFVLLIPFVFIMIVIAFSVLFCYLLSCTQNNGLIERKKCLFGDVKEQKNRMNNKKI